MSKNTVERLQKLENDIKAVISIYEIAYKTKEEVIEKTQIKKKASESMVKAAMKAKISPQSVQNVNLTQIKNTSVSKKPQSAPSSSSTLSGIGESDYSCEPQSNINYKFKAKIDRNALSQTEVVDNTNSSEWFDSETSPYEVFMTPSTTLEAAKKMLEKSNYQNGADGYEKESDEAEFMNFKNSEKNNSGHIKLCKEKNCYTSEGKTEKLSKTPLAHSNEKQNKIEKSNEFQRLRQTFKERDVPVSSKSFLIFKTSSDSKNLKSGTLSARNVTSKNISALEKHYVDTPTKKILTVDKEKKSSQKKERDCETLTDRKNLKMVCSSNGSTAQVKGMCNLTLKHLKNVEPTSHKYNIKKKQEKSEFFENKNTERQINTKTTEIEEEEEELDIQELCKIIEKSNEKLEKMKVSKELALDIAKQLKHKYEEIRQSKEELIERLNNVERDNERLSNEVKDAYDSKIKLQMKVKEFQRDSQTVFLEQDSQIRAIVEENKWLKNKLAESEQQHTAEVLEKLKPIERIQEERFKETIINHKKRKDKNERDVKTLTDENLQLVAKIDELHLFLCDRQSKVEALEGKIRELQEELQKQTQNLRQKTERLEETNKELESIRKNSEDLEEQVKALRKNIENFDQVHQNLIKQSVDYERQIKFNQEEIKTFQNENCKLKNELENEKDSILIKNKIIEDQQETIKQLREKSEEMKIVTRRNHSLERILNIEREEKLELQEALERLKARKDELKKKIKTLEGDLLLAPQEVVKDLQKTQIVLHELENQVQIKQKEWELHLQSLIKEKEQACSVAEFATRKLMQTTNEFQKQSEAHKRLHRVLAENLAKKERNRREVNEKENLIKHMTTDSHQVTRNSVQSTDKYQENSEDVVAIDALDWYQRNLTSCIDCQNEKPTQLI